MNSTNLFQPGIEQFDFRLYHNSSHERGFISSARVGISICVCNIVTNILLLFLIIAYKGTRRQFLMIQIANIAVLDLLTSVCVDILTIYHNVHPWTLGQVMCEAWLILDVVFPLGALLGVIMLNLDRLIFAVLPSFYYSLFKHIQARWLFLLTPWILSGVLVVPIWMLCDVPMQYVPFMCIYALTESGGMASSVISLFLPSIILVFCTVFVLVTVVNGLPKNLHEFTSLTFDELRVNSRTVMRRHNSIVLSLCIVNIATLIMQLPFGTLSIIEPECLVDPCTSIIDLLLTLSWLRSATPGVRALVWFLLTDIKRSCCCCVRSAEVCSDRLQIENVPMTPSVHTQHENLVSVTNDKSCVQ